MTLPSEEDDIPLLTDVLEEPVSLANKDPASVGSQAERESSPSFTSAAGEAEAGAEEKPAPDWEAIEQRLCTQLLIQVGPLLAQQVRATVTEALQQTANRLTAEIVLDLQQPLEDLIRQTVANEIQRLR